MFKKSIRNKLQITLLIIPTLFILGCSHSSSVTPVSTIQKNFTNDFDVNMLKEAITKAAEKNDWDIINPTSESINLKKVYITKKPTISALRVKRRYSAIAKNEVYVNVDIKNRHFTINPSDESKQSFKYSRQIEQFNKELANLEDTIYRELSKNL